jgi:hypothetical protein
MMTPTEIETDEHEKETTDNTAVLEVSSMLTGGNIKQDDVLSNYSTSVEGSVVRI